MATTNWNDLAILARRNQKLAGHYNDNYRLDHDGASYMFRFPRVEEAQMDPRPFAEPSVLAALAGKNLPVPEIIYVSPDNCFSVQTYIDGTLMDKAHPSGSPLPSSIQDEIAKFYGRLARLECPGVADSLAPDWPRKGPALTFFEKILEKSWKIQDEYRLTHAAYYDFLNLPKDPYSGFLARGSRLRQRPWQLIHADLHRGNMIVRPDGTVAVIDWELALYGDFLYCIAAHLHRMMYSSAERAQMAQKIKAALPEAYQERYEQDLGFYLDYEALKSIITDTVRFPDIVQNKNKKESELLGLAIYYTDNLNRLAPLLGNKTAKPEAALDWFREWAV